MKPTLLLLCACAITLAACRPAHHQKDGKAALPITGKLPVKTVTGPTTGKQAPPLSGADSLALHARITAALKKTHRDNYKGAAEEYGAAIKLAPGYAQLYLEKATQEIEMQDYDAALADCNTFITMAPHNAEGYRTSGFVKGALHDYAGSVKDYDSAITIAAQAHDYLNRGILKAFLQDDAGAIPDYRQALAGGDTETILYSNKAAAEYYIKDFTAAIADFSAAIALEPNNAGYYIGRGQAKEGTRNYIGAAADYIKALRINYKITAAYDGSALQDYVVSAWKKQRHTSLPDSARAGHTELAAYLASLRAGPCHDKLRSVHGHKGIYTYRMPAANGDTLVALVIQALKREKRSLENMRREARHDDKHGQEKDYIDIDYEVKMYKRGKMISIAASDGVGQWSAAGDDEETIMYNYLCYNGSIYKITLPADNPYTAAVVYGAIHNQFDAECISDGSDYYTDYLFFTPALMLNNPYESRFCSETININDAAPYLQFTKIN